MGLEPMTSPLPRECSTTELHQHSLQPNFPMLPHCSGSRSGKEDANGKEPEEHQGEIAKLAGLHGEPGKQTQETENGERDNKASAACRAEIHEEHHLIRGLTGDPLREPA